MGQTKKKARYKLVRRGRRLSLKDKTTGKSVSISKYGGNLSKAIKGLQRGEGSGGSRPKGAGKRAYKALTAKGITVESIPLGTTMMTSGGKFYYKGYGKLGKYESAAEARAHSAIKYSNGSATFDTENGIPQKHKGLTFTGAIALRGSTLKHAQDFAATLGGRRTKTRYVYDEAAAQALRKEEYQKHLGIYGTALSKLDPFKIPRTQLGGRPQKRFARGALRGAGLPGRKQRKGQKQSTAYKAYLKQAKAGLQRYREEIESYRSQWGL